MVASFIYSCLAAEQRVVHNRAEVQRMVELLAAGHYFSAFSSLTA